MREESRYFDICPRIVPANRESAIAIRPLFDHCRFVDGCTYKVAIYPTEGSSRETQSGAGWRLRLAPDNGVLRVPCFFEGEQEYVLIFEGALGENNLRPAEFRVYALEDDLFARRPFKGDFHLHSYRSDGRESPAYVAAASRAIGLDFMAVTDHRRYAPSLEAMHAFAHAPIALRIYPGEEVHPPDSRVHIVNFGGRFSLNERFADEAAFRAEVQAIEDTLGALPAKVDRYAYAASVWCFRKIRETGGLGIFCHPYWFTNHRYDVTEALTTQILEDQPFDALELIGGYHRFETESNALQVARYHEERARGKRIPIVGASDAHGCERGELFGWYYTIVFAPSTELPDLIQSIKDLYSVAVEALPGEMPRAHGPFRLVKYAHFLLREVLPLHDEFCAAEGRLMLEYLAGDMHAREALCARQGDVAAFYGRVWGII